jgi:hypothetical protein
VRGGRTVGVHDLARLAHRTAAKWRQIVEIEVLRLLNHLLSYLFSHLLAHRPTVRRIIAASVLQPVASLRSGAHR